MISSLRELAAPLSEQEFYDLLRARRLNFRRGVDENQFKGLLDWSTLRGLIERGIIPSTRFSLKYNTENVPPLFYMDGDKVDADKFAKLFEQGVSLITYPIESTVPALKRLCDDIEAHIGESVRADAVVTTGAGGALKLHYDTADVVALQIEGSKRWRVYDATVTNPVKGMSAQTPPQSAPVFDDVLRPGDILAVPAGYWHHCDNGPGLSLHLSILIRPPTGLDAVKALLPQLVDDPIFRVPLTRFNGTAEAAVHEAALKARLIETVSRMSLAEEAAKGAKARRAKGADDD